jgi:carboxypeptidase Taq
LTRDSDEARLIRVARRDFEKAIKLATDYVARASANDSASYDAWTRARPANDFAAMQRFLEKAIDLSREYAGFFAPYQHIADPLIDVAEEGMTTEEIRTLFAGLKRELLPVVGAICNQPPPSDACLRGSFEEGSRLAFSLSVVKRFGYDLDRGRLEKTHHPFCSKFCLGISGSPPASTKASLAARFLRPCTREGMRFTSKGSPRPLRAHHSELSRRSPKAAFLSSTRI